MNYANIPQELKSVKQWVARADKVPISPITLYGANPTDNKTWGSFEQALAAMDKPCTYKDLKTKEVKKGVVNGIGFVFAPPYCGIDIDHCINTDTGEINAEALNIISIMNSYTEHSPSGTGFHIIYKGEIHSDWRKKIANALGEGIHLEMYQQGRYFTITGDSLENHTEIREAETAAQTVYKAYAEANQDKPQPTKIKPLPLSVYDTFSDSKIIELASRSNKSFPSLWRGDFANYGSQSEADLALCNILAFYADEGEQIDSLFGQSGLMREKWDEKHGAKTYGEMTIERAVAGQTSHYDPNYKRTKAVEDFKQLLPLENKAIKGQSLPKEKKSELPEFTYETVKKYTADDIGASEFFSDMVKSFVCYVPEIKLFRVYNGGKWKDDTRESLAVGNILIHFVVAVQALIPPKPLGKPKDWTPEQEEEEKINSYFRSEYKNLGNANGRERLLKDIKKHLYKSVFCFDKQPYLFNVKNGTLNLETGQLQPHTPTDYISKVANVEYNPQAKEERFERFITEITEGSTNLAGALQRALGYSLQGKANEECFFVALGETTRNGKGTLFGTVENIFGDYGTTIAFDSIARTGSKDGSRATPDIARLQGVRFVSCNEPDRGSCFNEALLKQLTGSDRITARPLFGESITFLPVFKLFLTANSMPSVADNSIFESNRMKIIPFKHHFSEQEQDKHLKDKLQTENAKSAVLNWLLDGYKAYRLIGLGATAEMKELTDKYQYDNDYIQQYIDDRLILFPDGDCHAEKTTVKAIRADYENWCSVIGTKALGLKLFKEEIQKRGIKIISSHKQFAIRGKIKSGYDYIGEKALI